MKYLASLVLLISVASCDYFKKPQAPKAIARVGEAYLYEEEIENLVPKGTSDKDSVAIIRAFVDRWATQKILLNAAEVNLSESRQEEFNQLIEQYKTDLFTNAYLEDMVIRKIDTVVTEEQIVAFYDKNKQLFKNANELVKLRYINLVKENPKFDKIKAKFSSFTTQDKKELNEMSIQFKSYAFNDSVWVDVNQVYEKLPFINADNKDQYIADGINFQHPDSTTVWLVKVKQVMPKDSPTPLQFIKPTIRQVIINNRKLELVKTLEKEITEDAIKNKDYEIYK
ncbi:hypothetical protein DI487_02905 [Flavobacterium sediminis]|uniref:Peptidylprolyl isomerase n=1 Tax=Flavobacterium sediminis TaxID=2201181 RepID=A0A2U8QRY0_9FLAO|nr:hypothetical protein [Flavobacterium sediminis]AWM12917.1 hypothetical protein DI487_02905 [Flavobacterium sediminis]